MGRPKELEGRTKVTSVNLDQPCLEAIDDSPLGTAEFVRDAIKRVHCQDVYESELTEAKERIEELEARVDELKAKLDQATAKINPQSTSEKVQGRSSQGGITVTKWECDSCGERYGHKKAAEICCTDEDPEREAP